ncbi:XrtA/PEP-CTERM system amidotransferase [Pseudorhodoferax sp. Leaf265]|uniref:XrtA/PEP-CTERM system amidotransferase n=1 Tax=Pseudorhodoferax sp. Leaf265 TaxID=1736315 RepID=UPI0006FCC8FE|nr:XrtA/PEP-CTERM system amidotransferase [Pseudorhodoferax sp. Leaf265]KQP05241.1 asparagine synthase [Pseudorhodoferax sp. Leaf265]PZP96708.1 MAG: amidotransferase 1, exosortase A system-associated [Variovorax paradoxus]PZQ07927.1 MAG: amidotransferase 1, exosortase A system-associated [Variovorax paradoxus]
MCGISGLFDLRGARAFSPALMSAINDIQAHRGPDEADLHLEPGLAMGHRRLSVIDLATGIQPQFNEDGSVVIVFNGEIYNYRELTAELKALGHVFKTRSDTEVIVHAWEAWGEDCLHRLRGMFAFGLWDRNQQVLFLARDRMGVKPMHYALLPDGSFVFGSELKVITAHPAFARKIDPLAVEEYFALGYVADPRCIYEGAFKLPPGHKLLLRRGMARIPAPQAYWDVRFSLDNPISLQDAQAELLQRIDESVRLRLVADVPLGAFLSGGVDSSAVVASMAQVDGSRIKTCAIGFDDPRFNESQFAQMVADRYRTDHSLDIVGSNDFDLIDTLAWLYDEPFADSSAVPTYRVCQMARKHVTVALSGDGGDESFGGYRRYRLHLAEEKARRALPLGLRRPLFGALGQLYPKADWAPRVFRAKTTFQALAFDSAQAYLHSVSVLRADERERLYSASFKRRLGGYSALDMFRTHAERAGTDDPLALVQYLDYKTWLVGDINTKVDRAGMAHSLEVREPLMDHQLIEWLATLPSALKVQGQEGKYLLKKAFEPRLPSDVLYRPKMGFSVPLASWLRGPLAERTREALLGPRMADAGYFDPDQLRSMVRQHQSGQRDFSAPLWTLLMFEAFLRQLEQRPVADAAAASSEVAA